MELKTYFWAKRIIHPMIHSVLRNIRPGSASYRFKIGNCGDIFNKNLFRYLYGKSVDICNTNRQGGRLLAVGSIAQNLRRGDVVCGIGTKSKMIPRGVKDITIYGLRGPISYDIFKKAGYRLRDLKFLYDPGLLLGAIIPESLYRQSAPHEAIFIPHYRERYLHSVLPKGIRFCDIDNYPEFVAKEILNAELVYTSSLHGIIFSHSLGRRAVFVAPQTDESELKYKDYYASVGLEYRKPLSSIFEANYIRDDRVPFDISYAKDDFVFPTIDELITRGVANS